MFGKKSVLMTGIVMITVVALALPTFTHVSSARQDDVLKIGVLTDHSGALQIYGFEQTQGFHLGLEYATGGTMEVAGRKIEVVEADNGSDIDTANSQVRELIEQEGVEILQGSASSTVTLAVQQAAAEYEMVLMAGPAASPAITGDSFNEYTFRACRNSFQDSYTMGSYAIEAFGPNYVQLAVDNAFGSTSAAAFDFVLQGLGGTPAQDTILVAADTTDFTDPLEQVRASGADFWILTWAGAGTVELTQQIATLGINDDVPAMPVWNSDAIMVPSFSDPTLADYFMDTIGFTTYQYTLPGQDPDNPNPEVNEWLVENHKAEYEGTFPGLFTECGFASAQALVAALEITEGSTDPADLIPALEGLEWAGPKGLYHMRAEDHQVLVPMYIAKVVNTDDPEYKFYEWVATISPEDTTPPCLAPGRSSDTVTCPPAAQ
ncbi:MAG: substrate-binding domain-containing protein [Chloroflexi bacterium]|nr:substrate-binding domain-containing protein [Chloroflexota bacterium]